MTELPKRLVSFLEWLFAHPRVRSVTLNRPGMDPEVIRPEARVHYMVYSDDQLVGRTISYKDYCLLVELGTIPDALGGPLPAALDHVGEVPSVASSQGRHVRRVGHTVRLHKDRRTQ